MSYYFVFYMHPRPDIGKALFVDSPDGASVQLTT